MFMFVFLVFQVFDGHHYSSSPFVFLFSYVLVLFDRTGLFVRDYGYKKGWLLGKA